MAVVKRALTLTQELVALVERTEPDPGPEPGSVDHTAEEFSAMADDLVAAENPQDLWIFAYGSLIWNPEFEFVESRPAIARGWHRSFCITMTRWRGTRDLPTLMMALDRGGTCNGIVYRLSGADHPSQVARLLEREIDGNPPTNVPRWITVATEGGSIRALTFVADRKGPAYAGRRDLDEVASVLARAAGHWGSAATYLYRTVSKLDEHRIYDRNLWTIQARVAEHIAAEAPARGGR